MFDGNMRFRGIENCLSIFFIFDFIACQNILMQY